MERAISRILYNHDHFTGMPVTRHLLQPTRRHQAGNHTHKSTQWALAWDVFLFGLAPDGVYHALTVTCTGGELLPRHFTLTGSEDPAVFFLWHFPPVTRRSRYEPSCPAEFGLSSRVLRPERSCTRSNSLYSGNPLTRQVKKLFSYAG